MLNHRLVGSYHYDAYLAKAVISAIHLDRFEDTLIAFDHAIQVNPTSTPALSGKAYLLFEAKHYEEAVIAFEQINQLCPYDPTPYFEKGEALLRIEHYEEALISFEQVLHLDPKQLIALYKKGEALFGSGLYEEALAIFKQTISYFEHATFGVITHGYHNSPLYITGLMYMVEFYDDARKLFASLKNSQVALNELEECYKQAKTALNRNINSLYESYYKDDFPEDYI